MPATPGVSVVVPTYNEAQTAHSVVDAVYSTLARPAEVIVVDDDSPDGTAAKVRRKFSDVDDVQVIVREAENGLSSAVVRGFDAASHEYLGVIDADGQHPTGAISALAKLLDDGADLAIGSRHTESGDVQGEWPTHRRAISAGAQTCASIMVPQAQQVTDPMSGLFVIRAEFVDAARDRLDPCGYKILLELLARCAVDDIRELGITFSDRKYGNSSLGLAEYLRFLRHLARLSVPARCESAGVSLGGEHGVN